MSDKSNQENPAGNLAVNPEGNTAENPEGNQAESAGVNAAGNLAGDTAASSSGSSTGSSTGSSSGSSNESSSGSSTESSSGSSTANSPGNPGSSGSSEANQNCKILRMLLTTKRPILYGDEASPPVRFAMMAASMLNIYVEFHKIDIFKGEHKTEFYSKINPLQKVPALAMNDDVLCDSHAIALHLCRLSKNNELYPEEDDLRAKIDELLFFNSGVLFPIDSEIFTDFFADRWPANPEKVEKWYSALDHLEHKLKNHQYLTGDKVRLCDLCCGATVSSAEILIPFLERHKRVKEWLSDLTSLSCFMINIHGLRRLQTYVKEKNGE